MLTVEALEEARKMMEGPLVHNDVPIRLKDGVVIIPETVSIDLRATLQNTTGIKLR